MNRSINRAHLVLGSAAALALVAGCSHRQPPAQQPTPSFETGTSSSAQPGATSGTDQANPPAAQMGGMPAPGSSQVPAGTDGQGSQGATQGSPGAGQGSSPGASPGSPSGMGQGSPSGLSQGSPSGMGQGSTGIASPGTGQGNPGNTPGAGSPMNGEPSAPGAEVTTMTPHQMCAELGHEARLTVVDVPGGIAIIAHPKTGTDLSTVRDTAHRLERAMAPIGNPSAPMYGADTCYLFDLTKSGATTAVTEGTSEVRILVTTPTATDVPKLRRDARRDVQAIVIETRMPGALPGGGMPSSTPPAGGAKPR